MEYIRNELLWLDRFPYFNGFQPATSAAKSVVHVHQVVENLLNAIPCRSWPTPVMAVH